MQEVISQVEKVLLGIPDVVKEKVIAGIGTGDGQVLQPIERKVDEVSRAMKTRIDDAVKFLAEDIDPDKETSRVAKVFSRLEKALDPDYVKSVPSTIELSLKEITGVDGQLAKNVRSVVMDSIKPLQDQVNRLSREIVGQDAVDEAIQETTVKGHYYEEATVSRLQEWAVSNGIEVHHVGGDNNPGDIVLRMTSGSLCEDDMDIVIETRDRQNSAGRKRINDSMERSINERSATCGIYVSKDQEGLG